MMAMLGELANFNGIGNFAQDNRERAVMESSEVRMAMLGELENLNEIGNFALDHSERAIMESREGSTVDTQHACVILCAQR